MVPWTRRRVLAGALVVGALTATLVVPLGVRAAGDRPPRCERFAAESSARAADVTGHGEDVVVIGDSWSVGLGLTHQADSWPSRLPGRVHVAGFSGSGFSEGASSCADVSFADRAPDAVRRGADLVVVEGGLNDYDQSDADIRTGFGRLMGELRGQQGVGRIVVVGPALAPVRAAAVERVDALLAGLAASYDVPYVRTSGLDLPYLADRLHLTLNGHRAFGGYVAAQIARLGTASTG